MRVLILKDTEHTISSPSAPNPLKSQHIVQRVSDMVLEKSDNTSMPPVIYNLESCLVKNIHDLPQYLYSA